MLSDTPIEQYELPGLGPVWVKREDLCCPRPGPPFSKVRGILLGLRKLHDAGITVVGYAESKVSMATWGVAWACSTIDNIHPISYVSNYKDGLPPLMEAHRRRWEALGCETRYTKPNRGKIIHNRAKSELEKEFGPKAKMLPMGLPFPETTEETARQVLLIGKSCPWQSVVLCVGSGVVAGGVLKGFSLLGSPLAIYGVAIRYFDNPTKKKNEIEARAGITQTGLFRSPVDFRFVNTNYEYLQFEEYEPPFPCNPYYDRKAWKWLVDNYHQLKPPVLFWNIGAGGIPEKLDA